MNKAERKRPLCAWDNFLLSKGLINTLLRNILGDVHARHFNFCVFCSPPCKGHGARSGGPLGSEQEGMSEAHSGIALQSSQSAVGGGHTAQGLDPPPKTP
ncbi:unnamed protein product [Boreogadus saida]